ncbi:cell division protein FtsB [Herminiimonas sp. CN]|uniref:cell division protein FtsB n=1 Tax=Herminiimonas sp. CN TaxID=1349818 RepID=UPI00047413F7|nr:cell division protein FtsB [Herminiimonas sp. CN]
MRLISILLLLLLVLIQHPLWLGKGGWLRVWDLDQQVSEALDKNRALKARNDKLESEVRDLQEGTGAIEERARYELGMIKDGEIFVQLLANTGAAPLQITPPAATHPKAPAAAKPAH